MKKLLYQIITVSIIIALLTSCSSTFYYSILDTKDEQTEKVENGDFLLETDSLWIAYCFKGESAPIQITVFNKTDKPLYIDWERSALIVNDLAVNYTGKSFDFNVRRDNFTSSTFYTDRSRSYGSTYTTTSDDIGMNLQIPPRISFIPPKTMISENTLNIQIGINHLDQQNFKKQIMGDKNNNAHDIKRAQFTDDNTPLKFRSYLTIYAEPDKPMSFEQEFYISSVIKTRGIKPGSLPGDLNNRGDWFYLEKPANNSFVAILLGTTVIAGTAILDASLNSHEY